MLRWRDRVGHGKPGNRGDVDGGPGVLSRPQFEVRRGAQAILQLLDRMRHGLFGLGAFLLEEVGLVKLTVCRVIVLARVRRGRRRLAAVVVGVHICRSFSGERNSSVA